MNDQIKPMKVCEISIMQFIDENGMTSFAVRRDGDEATNMSTWLGLLELAKDSLLRQFNEASS